MAESYGDILRDTKRAQWDLDRAFQPPELDFERPFLPEAMVHVSKLDFLTPRERVVVSQIRAQTYLETMMFAEKVIVPFIMSRAAQALHVDHEQFLALMAFGHDEAKHILLFERFARHIDGVVGASLRHPAQEISSRVLTHHSLAIALVVLHIDALADAHARLAEESSEPLEPQLVELLRIHALDEARHLRLDRLILQDLLERSTPYERNRAVQQYVSVMDDMSASFGPRAGYDVCAFESHVRALDEREAETLQREQARSYDAMMLHAGLTHPLVQETLDALGGPFPEIDAARARYTLAGGDSASRACA